MVPASQPEDANQRVRCLYCGANNFGSAASCWQCARPLKAMREPAQGPPLQAKDPFAARPAGANIPPGASPAAGFSALNAVNSNAAAAYSLSPKAAAALGLLMPWFGLPIGIVFLMLDDPRKAQLGWITIGWSIAGTILNIVAGIIVMGPLIAGLHSLLPSGSAPGAGGRGGGMPSIPGVTGGDDGLDIIGVTRGLWLLVACRFPFA